MLRRINIYLRNMPERKKWAAFITIGAGILFPLILMAALASTYGSISNIFDFGPLRYAYLAFLCLSALVLIIATTDLIIQSHNPGRYSRFPFIGTWITAGLSIFLIVILSGFVAISLINRTGNTPPQLLLTEKQTGEQEIALVFWTNEKTVNKLEWGLNSSLNQIIKEQTPSHHHWFQFDDLQADSLYSYLLNGKIGGEFKTPPNSGKILHFAASGDPHFGNPGSNNARTAEMLNYIKDPANDFSMLFILGDSADLGFFDSFWKQAFNTISSCSSSVPTCYVIGNHDTIFGGLSLYQDYLCEPSLDDGKGHCLWKRIDNGNIHFLILDMEWDLRLYSPAQQEWLVSQLETIPRDDWCIVMCHTFFYCSGSYKDGWQWYDNTGTIEKLTPLFEQYDVDLVLSGHKHHTELLQKNGVTYVVMGSFGGRLDSERTYVSPASVWYRSGVYAFADIAISNSDATVIIRSYDKDELFKKVIKE